MDFLSPSFLLSLGSIILLDLVLAGDNAVVIAMAARQLPPHLQKRAIFIGTAGAIIVRALMTVIATWLLGVPLIQAIGGLILIPIAIKLLHQTGKDSDAVVAATSLGGAIRTIIVADVAMGIDNVLAIAGVAQGNIVLVMIGLLVSIPLVVWGSQMIARLMDQYPILVPAGAALLGYAAGTMLVHDPIVGRYLLNISPLMEYFVPAATILFILGLPRLLSKNAAEKDADIVADKTNNEKK
ncbi:MAG: TerC family protein [Negativicoccus massiliensis]|uniref:TerC family protein n=1 Tax=Negativicoccus succinicivorans TaxID=620903 RepID=UPI0026F280D8|nr:TerC family protein [Negativicoccus succinicivorans]MBS5887935.1 TerC family protein [Negativicoccus succinicivorans]MDU3214622.1 TerC family protein [Negativicoccus succinicivorans]MDU4641479.1 TerC family protein [Negativicoccus massiliensis]MDU5027167.1 TerC family protein [Negativicoccus succinicivorans]